MLYDNHILTIGFFELTGDVCGVTTYTRPDGTIIWFEKAPPKDPPTPAQLTMRNRWRLAIEAWRQLPLATRDAWQHAVKRASLKINPTALWVYYQTTNDYQAIDTIARQTAENLR